MLFKIANTVTPTSAKTALSIPVIPIAPKSKKQNLTPAERIMSSQTIFLVNFEILIADETFLGLSSTKTMSEASTLAGLPPIHMLNPTSASVSDGASLIPSPT